jgi:plasmid stabilization system protein ParE
MSVALHPGAERDLVEAAAFYEAEASPALAARFIAEFERVVSLLAANPGLGTPRARGRRGFPTSGFPYTVVYREVPEGILVLVVKHDRRRPGYGASRA